MDHPFGKSLQINPDNVTYGYESFDGFDVEIVYVNGKLKNEYHLKVNGDKVTNDELLVALCRQLSEDCEVGFVDRTGIITLEYPIYIIVKNQILTDEMHGVWIDIEQFLKRSSLEQ